MEKYITLKEADYNKLQQAYEDKKEHGAEFKQKLKEEIVFEYSSDVSFDIATLRRQSREVFDLYRRIVDYHNKITGWRRIFLPRIPKKYIMYIQNESEELNATQTMLKMEYEFKRYIHKVLNP